MYRKRWVLVVMWLLNLGFAGGGTSAPTPEVEAPRATARGKAKRQYVQIGNKRVQVSSQQQAEQLLAQYVEQRIDQPKRWKIIQPPKPEDDDEELLLILMALH